MIATGAGKVFAAVQVSGVTVPMVPVLQMPLLTSVVAHLDSSWPKRRVIVLEEVTTDPSEAFRVYQEGEVDCDKLTVGRTQR